MLRALDRNPEKLDSVARFVADLRATPEGRELLPPDFDAIWAADSSGARREVAAMTQAKRPDPEQVLRGLKDFQRDTVEYVFRRMYTDDPVTRRFLVADEVGLGKTLVARGLIARAVDHLWDTVPRIDVVYICSNADIAQQNLNRLRLPGWQDFSLASRITLLPLKMKELRRARGVNFVSFTPGTSFDMKSSLGTGEERALLYHLLRRAWNLSGEGSKHALEGWKGRENFEWQLDNFPTESIDRGLRDRFVERANQAPGLRERFDRDQPALQPRTIGQKRGQ